MLKACYFGGSFFTASGADKTMDFVWRRAANEAKATACESNVNYVILWTHTHIHIFHEMTLTTYRLLLVDDNHFALFCVCRCCCLLLFLLYGTCLLNANFSVYTLTPYNPITLISFTKFSTFNSFNYCRFSAPQIIHHRLHLPHICENKRINNRINNFNMISAAPINFYAASQKMS